jgi:hypothetical protein
MEVLAHPCSGEQGLRDTRANTFTLLPRGGPASSRAGQHDTVVHFAVREGTTCTNHGGGSDASVRDLGIRTMRAGLDREDGGLGRHVFRESSRVWPSHARGARDTRERPRG